MKRQSKSRRKVRVQLIAAIAASVLSVELSHASVLYDDETPLETGTAGVGLNGTGDPAGEYMGNGIILAAGANDITGFDCLAYNGTTTNLSNMLITVYVWGGLNLGTISSSAPAFSDELEVRSFLAGNVSAGSFAAFDNSTDGTPGATPGLPLGIPLALPSNAVGITFNFQGSTDAVNYSSMPGLTSIITSGVGPTVGSNALGNNFDLAAAGETNGNFATGPYFFSDSSGTALSNQAYAARIYGDFASTTPANWLTASNGSWEVGTKWSTGAAPDGGTNAVFNLNSGSVYTVAIPASTAVDVANNVYIQQDKVAFNLDAQNSELAITRSLVVGQPPAGASSATGSLTLENTINANNYPSLVVAGNIVVGGNGGTGTLTINTAVYLFTSGDTAINSGSKLVIGGGEFETNTLTFAGTTNNWGGQLDIGSYQTSVDGGNYANVMNQLKSGYNGGNWNGSGIISSAAAADTTHLTAVGSIVNNDGKGNVLYGTGATLGPFDANNTDPGLNAVLLRYTYYGDANLDGQVDSADYALIDNGFLSKLTGWYNGDFNYDGVVNGSDYTLIDNAYNMQANNIVTGGGYFPAASSASLSDHPSVAESASIHRSTVQFGSVLPVDAPYAATTTEIAIPATSAVPEPAALTLFAALPLLCRRHRRR